MKTWQEKLFKFTPLGRADVELRKYFDDDEAFLDTEEYSDYEASRKKFRNRKLFEVGVKALLYASVITSVAVALGFPQIRILNRIASYFGVSVLLLLYVAALYSSALYREEYYLRRELLISSMGEKS